jgi:hypothetical protein
MRDLISMHILNRRHSLKDNMSDGGFRGSLSVDQFTECSAFHEFHDNVTNDGLFFGLLERVVVLNNIRLLSARFGSGKYVIEFSHHADFSFQVLADVGSMKRPNHFDGNNLICVDFLGFMHCTECPTTS